jgi:hypothetical protein
MKSAIQAAAAGSRPNGRLNGARLHRYLYTAARRKRNQNGIVIDRTEAYDTADRCFSRAPVKKTTRLCGPLSSIIALAILGCVAPLSEVLAQPPGILHATYHFRLIRGRGVSVCVAFLKRLQVTHFTKPPYCGIPENDVVPGFSFLHRVPLSKSQIVELFPKVFSFTYKQNQDVVPPQSSPSEIRGLIEQNDINAWTYSPEIDVDNNGRDDNIVLWQGSGNFVGVPTDVQCGAIGGVSLLAPPDGARTSQIPLVLSKDDQRIDEHRTRELFEAPGIHPEVVPGLQNLSDQEFVPLGEEMGFFAYHRAYYIYAFAGHKVNQRRPDKVFTQAQLIREERKLNNTLSVYVRRDATVRELCAYQMSIHPRKQ